MCRILSILVLACMLPFSAMGGDNLKSSENLKILEIDAVDKEDRTEITTLGVAIEEVYDDYVVGIANEAEVEALSEAGFDFREWTISEYFEDFPIEDSLFHNLDELADELEAIEDEFPDIATLYDIGESLEGRPLYMMRLSGAKNEEGSVPGIIFLATHHAREHLSTEVALYLLQFLAENYGTDPNVTELIDEREIWIMPMVNPDGADHDVQDPSYKWWRKNRRANDKGKVHGVDLNRNYGYKWGGAGASSSRSSQTYRGPEAFSEPETQAIRDFLQERENITILLSYHTFSELILYHLLFYFFSTIYKRDLEHHDPHHLDLPSA